VETFARKDIDAWLLAADVYRRDEIDSSHAPVFHHMEGGRTFETTKDGIQGLCKENARLAAKLSAMDILIEDDTWKSTNGKNRNPVQAEHDPEHAELVAQNLKHHLNSMIYGLFTSDGGEPLRVRWIPAYFPFTSPSYEVEVFFGGKWLEILGCGVTSQRIIDLAGTSSIK
jgi:phenylalanyl-tRNA synthetase alpha chain